MFTSLQQEPQNTFDHLKKVNLVNNNAHEINNKIKTIFNNYPNQTQATEDLAGYYKGNKGHNKGK